MKAKKLILSLLLMSLLLTTFSACNSKSIVTTAVATTETTTLVAPTTSSISMTPAPTAVTTASTTTTIPTTLATTSVSATPTTTAIPTKLIIGNSNTNLVKDGIVARQGDWIYYSGYPYAAFYKIKVDGSQKTKISSSIGGYLNMVGDWIYFCSITNGRRGGLKKMRLDGTQETPVGDVKKANYLNIVGDWIYYKNAEAGSDYLIGRDGKLCKMRLDGTGNTQLTDDNAGSVVVIGDWIYYENSSDNGHLYRVKTDGTGKTSIIDFFKMGSPSDFMGWLPFYMEDNYLYYLSSDPTSSGLVKSSIKKVKTDGTGEAAIGGEKARAIAVSEGWIYFSNMNDGNRLYKIRTDGSQKKKLSDDRPYTLYVLGDWLFAFVEGSKTDNLIKIKTDGTGRAELK